MLPATVRQSESPRGPPPVPAGPAAGRHVRRLPPGGQIHQTVADAAAEEPRNGERPGGGPPAGGHLAADVLRKF